MKVKCHMCSKEGPDAWPCTKHKRKPGFIHTGRGAAVDSFWPCPNCGGEGHIPLSWLDRLLLYLARRMADLRRTVDGAGY